MPSPRKVKKDLCCMNCLGQLILVHAFCGARFLISFRNIKNTHTFNPVVPLLGSCVYKIYTKIDILKGGTTVIDISADKAAALLFFVVLHLFGYSAPLLLECGGEEREISTTSRKFRKLMSIASRV